MTFLDILKIEDSELYFGFGFMLISVLVLSHGFEKKMSKNMDFQR